MRLYQADVTEAPITTNPMKRADFLLKTKQILLQRRDELRRSSNGELALRSRSEDTADEGDEAQDAEGDEVFSWITHCESQELAAIENALDRIRQGHFGVCEECSGKIPLARLQALPYATLCIRCQRELELEQRRPNLKTFWVDSDWSNVLDIPDADSLSFKTVQYTL